MKRTIAHQLMLRQPAKVATRAAATDPLMRAMLVVSLFLMLFFFAFPVHADTVKSAQFGNGFSVDGSATGIGEEARRAALAREPLQKTFLLNGTLTRPTVLGTPNAPVNLYMNGGVGMTMADRSYTGGNYLEAAPGSGNVTPAFRVGMGFKYNF